MTLDEMITELYGITNRPDLAQLSRSAIKAATLKLHKTDFYSKDIHETGISFTESDYIQSLDLYSLIPNFRAMKYLRIVSDRKDDEGTFIHVVTPEETIDEYGANRTDVAYVAGRFLEIRSSISFTKALLGCYILPIVTDVGYATWMSTQFPYAIIYEAARVVFRSIGQLDQAAGMGQQLAEEVRLLKISAITDTGY